MKSSSETARILAASAFALLLLMPPISPGAESAAGPAAPPADVQAAINMPPGAARDEALTSAVKTWAGTAPIDAMMFGASIKDKGLQRRVLETTGGVWVDKDEKAAIAWAFDHGNGIQQHYIFGWYGGREKQAGAEWLLAQPRHNPGEFGVLMEAWCGHGKDNQTTTAEAAAWFLRQKQLSKEDATPALYFIAAALAWNDPPAASLWVTNLPANFPIASGASAVANIWSRKIPADVAKIRDWIQKLPITYEEKASVAKAIVTPK